MLPTEKIYNTESYLAEFSCRVISVEKTEKGYDVICDKTAFFPEAGGQTCDKGTLDGETVEHVRIHEDIVIHTLRDFHAAAGDTVQGKIDMVKRLSDMQQHSGEHILSGTAYRLFGCENVGFHLGAEIVTVDLNKPLSAEQVRQLESEANQAVRDNRPIQISFPSAGELKSLNYRSKKELLGQIRIVTIDGVDCCACCAPHLSATGEVGLIRIVSFENHRGGTRLGILCGERAVTDMQKKLQENKKCSALLCVKETETSDAVSKLLQEKADAEYRLKCVKIELLKHEAAAVKPKKNIVSFLDSDEPELLREYTNLLVPKAQQLVAVFGKKDGKVVRYVLCTPGAEVSAVCKTFNGRFAARGGGRGEMAQGSVSAQEQELTVFFADL